MSVKDKSNTHKADMNSECSINPHPTLAQTHTHTQTPSQVWEAVLQQFVSLRVDLCGLRVRSLGPTPRVSSPSSYFVSLVRVIKREG